MIGWMLLAISGCGRAGGAGDETLASAAPIEPTGERRDLEADESPERALAARLERLRKRGEFGQFVDAALSSSESASPDVAVELLKVEALLASGRNEAAGEAALAAAELAQSNDNALAATQALKLYAVAQFRQRQSLDDPIFAGVLATLPAEDASAEMLRYWRDTLRGRIPYLLDGAVSEPTEVPASRNSPADRCAIEAQTNGIALPLVFIDTGAQHSLMTTAAARRAGVTLGKTATPLVGFAGLRAQPGVLETLQLGGLTLHNVPILVGDRAPLVALNGQMALGTELMHHVLLDARLSGRSRAGRACRRRESDGGGRIELANSAVDVFAGLPRARPQRNRGGRASAARHGQSCRHVRLGSLGAAQLAPFFAGRLQDWSSNSSSEI